MADKKISEFPIFDGVQDAQTYYILASGEAGDPDADNYKMPFTHLAQDITANLSSNLSLYSGLSGVFDHLTSGASGIFTELLSGKTGAFTEELLLAGKPIVSENADGGVDLGSTEPPPAGTDAPPVNLLHGGEQKISMDDDIIVIGGVNNDPADQVEIINPTTIKETLTVADGKDTTLGGNTTIKGTTNLNSSLTVADGQDTTLGGATTIKGATTFDSTANFTDSTKITFGSSTPAQTLQDIIDAGGKWSDGTSAGDIYYSSGKVGIGTETPSEKLEISNKNSTGIGDAAIAFTDQGGIRYTMGIKDGSQAFQISENSPLGQTPSDATKGTRFLIDTDGKVGIGTTSPGATLHVKADDDSTDALAFWVVDKAHVNSIITAYENGYVQIGKFTYDDATGNVGIGTLAPVTLLDINAPKNDANGNLLNNDVLISFSKGNTDEIPQGKARIGLAGMTSQVLAEALTDDLCIRSDGNNIRFGTASATRTDMTIDSAGNVGIGTTSPTHHLHLLGDSQVKLKVESTAGNPEIQFTQPDVNDNAKTSSWMAGQSANDFFITKHGLGGGHQFVISNDGNVGIGTTDPDKALEIFNGALKFGTDTADLNEFEIFPTDQGSNGLGFYDRTNTAYRMLISNAGNVGIGTTSPSAKLEIIDTENHLNLKVSDVISQSILKFSDTDGLAGAINFDHNTNKLHFITDGTAIPSNGALNIDSAGNVGIGTTDPKGRLHVKCGENQNFVFRTAGTGGNTHLTMQSVNDAGTTNLDMGMGKDSNTLFLSGSGNVGIGTTSPGAKLEIQTETIWGTYTNEALTINNMGSSGNLNEQHGLGRIKWETNNTIGASIDAIRNVPDKGRNIDLVFSTNPGGNNTTVIERMRINHEGAIIIQNTTAPTVTTNKLHANAGKLYWNGSELASGNNSNVSAINDLSDVTITDVQLDQILYYNGTQWVNSAPTEPAFISDKKYKTEIFPISEALSKVNSIKGANFTWSDDAPSDLGGKKDVGVIAQDIQKVLPEAVEEKENGDLTVKYHRIIPLLIESIKELSEENKALKSRLDKIEGIS